MDLWGGSSINATANIPMVYILSDSIGETAEGVVKAAASQFDHGNIKITKKSHLRTIKDVEQALCEAAGAEAAVVYTLVRQDLKDYIENRAEELSLVCADILGPVMNVLQTLTKLDPKNQPGLLHKIDQTYLNKVNAIDFAVKYDDGKKSQGLNKADIVVIGVSRTSKTPLCMYLAHRGIKAANIPLVPEVPTPDEIFKEVAHKVIGLTINPSFLFEIRKERLKTMGLLQTDAYANWERILAELDFSLSVMHKIGCPIIDVTNKAVEETASKVLEFYRKEVKQHA